MINTTEPLLKNQSFVDKPGRRFTLTGMVVPIFLVFSDLTLENVFFTTSRFIRKLIN